MESKPLVFLLDARTRTRDIVRDKLLHNVHIVCLKTANEAGSLALAQPPSLILLDSTAADLAAQLRICSRDPALKSVPRVVVFHEAGSVDIAKQLLESEAAHHYLRLQHF